MDPIWLIALLIFILAALYASVGHGGATAYIALMTFLSMNQETIRPTALLLNVAVASIAYFYFNKRSIVNKTLFLPLLLSSVPAAFIGAFTQLNNSLYSYLIALFLLFSILRLMGFFKFKVEKEKTPPIAALILTGSIVGYLAGLTGIGGGVILSPLLLLAGWANVKQSAAISAAFILFNSIAGLAGLYIQSDMVVFEASLLFPVIMGGLVGAWIGSVKAPPETLKKVLASILFIAIINLMI